MKVKAVKTPAIRVGQIKWLDFLDKYVPKLEEGSIVAVTSKVVSLCEERVVRVGEIDKEELIESEADFYIPRELSQYGYSITIKNDILIPAAGIDVSNTDGFYVMWPDDAQYSANAARAFLQRKFGLKKVGVMIVDSKTSPLRWGTSGVCLAHSGFQALNDYVGVEDIFGREMEVTKASVVDNLAGTVVLAMGEGSEQTPIAVVNEVEMVNFVGRNPTVDELEALRIDVMTDLYGVILATAPWKRGGGGFEIGWRVSDGKLKKFLMTKILPRYNQADVGHNQRHIWAVLRHAYRLNQMLVEPVDEDLLTVAVLCHDLGVTTGTEAGGLQNTSAAREGHNERSARIVRAEVGLKEFFSDEEIERIAVACEQHRASYGGQRNDLLSKIVADADTADSINFPRIIVYFKEATPEATVDEILMKMLAHYRKKQHPQTGYARFDLMEAVAMIKPQRDLLWSMIDDEEKFKAYMKKTYSDLLTKEPDNE